MVKIDNRKSALPNSQQTIEAILIGIILYVANLAVRFFYCRFSPSIKGKVSSKDALIFSLGGIHGAVTFALAYTLSEMSVNIADFHLILVSEIVLILLSLTVYLTSLIKSLIEV